MNDEPGTLNPVTLLLLVSAPPPRPEIMATIVLPKDPPQAGVDLAMDANRDLAFPSNSFIGQGAFGQVIRRVANSGTHGLRAMHALPRCACLQSAAAL